MAACRRRGWACSRAWPGRRHDRKLGRCGDTGTSTVAAGVRASAVQAPAVGVGGSRNVGEGACAASCGSTIGAGLPRQGRRILRRPARPVRPARAAFPPPGLPRDRSAGAVPPASEPRRPDCPWPGRALARSSSILAPSWAGDVRQIGKSRRHSHLRWTGRRSRGSQFRRDGALAQIRRPGRRVFGPARA